MPTRLALALLVSLAPLAARAQEADDRVAASEMEAPAGQAVATRAAVGGGGAGLVPPRIVAVPPPQLQRLLDQALAAARPEVRQCLEQRFAGRRASARARVRIDRARRMTISITVRPSDAAAEACVDLAVRRHVQTVQAQPVSIVRPVTGTLRVSIGDATIPPMPPPIPPPMPNPRPGYDESQVHAALDAHRAELLSCAPQIARGMPGTMTLRVSVRPDGSMTLIGVDMPPGASPGSALPCLANRVAYLRVIGPPGERTVAHSLDL
jgi:hypothetical protein